MTKNRLYSPEYLKELVADPNSSVQLKKSVKEVHLQPFHLRDISGAVAEILDSSLLRYDASLDGLLLGYENAKRLGDKAPCHLESSQVSVKIQGDFYIFQPKIGNTYKAVVHKLGVAHIGCLLYNHFNISLPISPEKLGLLKTLTLQTKVTFIMEEFDLCGELPFFKGRLATVSSEPTVQLSESKKSKKQKDKSKLSVLNTSNPTEDFGITEKTKRDKHSKLALKESKAIKTASHQSKVETEADVRNTAGKGDKKKRSLSLKQRKLTEEAATTIISEDDSDHVITPFQRPTERSKLCLPNSEEESPGFDELKPFVKSLRDSPLKDLSSSDGSFSEGIFDFLKKDSPAKRSKKEEKGSIPVSQSVKKSSQKSGSDSSVLKNSKVTETPIKSPDSKRSCSQTSTYLFPFLKPKDSAWDDESTKSEKLISEAVHACTSPQKKNSIPKNTPVASSTQKSPTKRISSLFHFPQQVIEDSKKSGQRVSTRDKLNEQREAPSSSKPLFKLPLKNDAKSSSGDSDSHSDPAPAKQMFIRLPSGGLQGMAKPGEELSSDGSDFQPQKQGDKSSGDESDSEADVPKRMLTQSSKPTTASTVPPRAQEESSSESDSQADVPKRTLIQSSKPKTASTMPPRLQEESSSESDSGADAPKRTLIQSSKPTIASTMPPRVQEESSSESDSEADVPKRTLIQSSKRTTASTMPPKVQEESSSESDSDGKTAAPVLRTRPFSPKALLNNTESKKCSPQMIQKKLLLNQTCLDGLVQSRSPLACSTPTVENTKSAHKNPSIQVLLKPFTTEKQNQEKVEKKKKESKTDEKTWVKKGKTAGSLPKQSDPGFENLQTKRKKKREKKSKSGTNEDRGDASVDFEEQCRLLLERFGCDDTRMPSTIKKKKKEKSKKKLNQDVPDTVAVKTPTLSLQKAGPEPLTQNVKAKKKSKDEKKLKIQEIKPDDHVSEDAVAVKKPTKRKLAKFEDVKPTEERKNSDEGVANRKKRKLHSRKVDDSYSGVNISVGLLKTLQKNLVLNCKEQTDSNFKLPSRLGNSPVRESLPDEGDEKKRRSILFGSTQPSGSTVTQSDPNEEEFKKPESSKPGSKHKKFFDELSSVQNTLSDEDIDKSKKKKKKKKYSSIDSVPSIKFAPDAISPTSAPLEKKAKHSTEDAIDKKTSEQTPLTQIAEDKNRPRSKSQTERGLHSKTKESKRKKEKSSSIGCEPTFDLPVSVPVDSGIPTKKKKIPLVRGSTDTEDSVKKVERIKKKEGKNDECRTAGNEVGADGLDDTDLEDAMKRLIEKVQLEKGLAGTDTAAHKLEKKKKKKEAMKKALKSMEAILDLRDNKDTSLKKKPKAKKVKS